MAPRTTKRTRNLLRVLEPAQEVVVVAHDSPDPDAIASGWAVCVVVESVLKLPARFLASGVISRAENRELVDALGPPLTLTQHFVVREGQAVILVDTAFLPRFVDVGERRRVDAVIDHHRRGSGAREARSRFRDVRPRVIATSSMLCGYLRELELVPSAALATALTYGIQSDASGGNARFSAADQRALSWLAQYHDPELLARIASATLPQSYYEDLVVALGSTVVSDDVALCVLPRVSCVEVVGEIADLLVRCDGVDRVLCAGLVDGRIVCSSRTTSRGGSATGLLGKTLDGLEGASWGGHMHRAGGAVDPGQCETDVDCAAVLDGLRDQWLAATRREGQPTERLVPRGEILRTLRAE